MRSTDKRPPQAPAATLAQQDEHAVCMIPMLEAMPFSALDWERLIAGGSPPCLALGAERRNEPRKAS